MEAQSRQIAALRALVRDGENAPTSCGDSAPAAAHTPIQVLLDRRKEMTNCGIAEDSPAIAGLDTMIAAARAAREQARSPEQAVRDAEKKRARAKQQLEAADSSVVEALAHQEKCKENFQTADAE